MAYNYAYAPAMQPSWHFMEMPMIRPHRRRNRPYRDDYYDPISQIARQRKELDDLEEFFKQRQNKDKKEDKKPPTASEALMNFIAQLGVMILIGFPAGFIVLKSYEMMLKNPFN